MTKFPEVGKTYKHYKGGTYIVLTLAKHTENEDIVVVYKSKLFGGVFVKSLHVWNSTVLDSENNSILRFKKVK
jgi:hypothetical protein